MEWIADALQNIIQTVLMAAVVDCLIADEATAAELRMLCALSLAASIADAVTMGIH